jgi:hypothetical protein
MRTLRRLMEKIQPWFVFAIMSLSSGSLMDADFSILPTTVQGKSCVLKKNERTFHRWSFCDFFDDPRIQLRRTFRCRVVSCRRLLAFSKNAMPSGNKDLLSRVFVVRVSRVWTSYKRYNRKMPMSRMNRIIDQSEQDLIHPARSVLTMATLR